VKEDENRNVFRIDERDGAEITLPGRLLQVVGSGDGEGPVADGSQFDGRNRFGTDDILSGAAKQGKLAWARLKKGRQ